MIIILVWNLNKVETMEAFGIVFGPVKELSVWWSLKDYQTECPVKA